MPQIDPIPKRQLLSFKVRGPELAATFTELRVSGPLTYAQISERFAPPPEPRNDELLREGLEMLRVLELIWRIQPDEGSDSLYQVSEEVAADVPFPLLLLGKLRAVNDDRRVFRLIHDLVIGEDLMFVTRHDLLTRLESVYPQIEYAWNVEKVRTWRAMAEYLGLTRSVKPSGGDILVSPIPDLLTQLLLAYASHAGILADGKFDISLREWLEFVEANYCRCYAERLSVHQGLARALLSMAAEKRIRLTMLSDAGSVRLRDRAASHIELALVPVQ